MRNIIKFLAKFILIASVTYGFLALCNWSLNLPEWNGFSRFILGSIGVIFLIELLNEI